MFRSSARRKPKITIPTASAVDYRSESVTHRLGKIAEHYVQLEQVLADLESKIPQPPPAAPAVAEFSEGKPTQPR